MPVYGYLAKNMRGEVIRSSIDAPNRFDALSALRSDGMTTLELYEAERNPPPVPVAARGRKWKPFGGGRITLGERAVFCRQLAISVSSGVPLRESLESITDDLENPALRYIMEHVIQDLHDGEPFSAAVAKHAAAFDPLFVSLMRSAEEAGTMSETLLHLAESMDRRVRLIRKVRSITAYPVFVAVFFVIVCSIMTFLVLPRFERVLFQLGTERLPALTRIVFGANRALINHAPLIVAVGFGLGALLILYARSPAGRLRIDRLKLKLPFFGDCLRKIAIARFCRNLAVMIEGGVPITTGMEIASTICGNRVLEDALMDARENIIKGSNIAAGLAATRVFPRLVIRMVSVGEQSGRLPQVLQDVGATYEDQVEGEIMVATSLFEPVVICFFGGFVLLLVLAIYMPVFTMASGMR